MKNKKVFFRPNDRLSEKIMSAPEPAKKHVPSWYKDLKPNHLGKKFPTVDGLKSDKTAKACLPFLDSMTSGYMLTMPSDLVCDFYLDGTRKITWMSPDFKLVDIHGLEQIGEYPIPEGYDSIVFKMMGFWGIQAPKGYSLLYMNPLGRFDLPIYTFHGIVDADKHYVPMHIPFVIKKDFKGIIKRGTPYSQVIPILRENWESEVKPFNENEHDPKSIFADIQLSAENWYKEKFWTRKEYS